MKRKILKSFVILFLIFLIVSCAFGPFMADMLTPAGAVLKVDSNGAKAVAGTGSTSRSGSRGIGSKAIEEDAALVKILEDGTITSLIDTGDYSGWTPAIAFLSTGSDGSIYAGFECPIWSYLDGASTGVQFIRIYPDSTDYDVIWPPAGTSNMDAVGNIDVWGWWGMEQDPLVKGPDGKLYFKVSEMSGTTPSDSIYCYDPEAGGSAFRVTPENAELVISTFMIDSKKHLFIQSGGWDGTSATSIRFYTGNDAGYKQVYYSSNMDAWIRGYVPSPSGDFLVINGQNVRGMNGIIKVSDLDAAELTYELMYSESNGSNQWIQLYKHYDNNWENNTELIDMTSQMLEDDSFAWRDDVKDAGGNVDISRIYQKIQPYFYDTPVVTDEAFVTGPLTDSDGTHKLWEWIVNYPEEFLETYFTGALWKDWLAAHSMSDLYFSNIGSMLWGSDGALYGLYDSGWWYGGDAEGTKIVKLLDSSGNRALAVVSLSHGDEKPTMIKIEGDYIYYRYAVLDAAGFETGKHQLARMNYTTNAEDEILPADLADTIEIMSYDVSSDNSEAYFVGANPQTNEVINGKIDIAAGSWEKIDTTFKFGNIKVIE